ncbi:hypothetical protein [Gaetbulibacter aestuarii]|uniref:Dockerin domain-containing protein n=1 Tax=Gaetbulibacter aestuarii TaxID=1502358 RepID=A0ABW7N4U0_9FLAO
MFCNAISSVKLIFASFLIILGFCSSLNAQTTLIPDSQFEQYLVDEGFDSDLTINGQVLTSDISALNELNIIGYDISDFTGLQDFLALTLFTLINDQSSSSFSIGFGSNINLQEITIINTPYLNHLSYLYSLPNLTSLTVVTRGDLFNNINLYNNSNLVNLSLADNQLTSLDLSNNTKLKTLSVAINPLNSVDTSLLPDLETLDTYESQISYLDLSQNTKLTRLNGHTGVLTEVNLKNGNNNVLTSIQLENNPYLSCIQVDDPISAAANSGWIKDIGASYSDYCGYKIRTFPYVEDFESGDGGWNVVNVSNSSWELGTPSSTNLNTAASGNNAWVTNLSGNYNSNESGWIISPEFDFGAYDPIYGGLQIQFDIWYNCENNVDGAVFQSSIDGGSTWQNVGGGNFNSVNINPYNSNILVGAPGGQNIGWSGVSENIFSGGWKTVVFRIYPYNTDLLGEQSVFFRIAFGSNGSIENDGFAFDKFRISEDTAYAGEDASYNICIIPEDINKPNGDLSSYLVGVSNSCAGDWTSLDGLPFADTNENSINFDDITENGAYKFKYTTCFDEAIIEFQIQKKLAVGANSEFFDNNLTANCSELTFENDAAFQQWAFEKHSNNNTQTVDPGGTWTPSTFQGYGTYVYTQPATSSCSETSSKFLYNRKAPIVSHDTIQADPGDTNLYVLIDDHESSKTAKLALVKRKRGTFTTTNNDLIDRGEVDFPNTGTGAYYDGFEYIYTVKDDCGSIESITIYTFFITGNSSGGENGYLSICEGDMFDQYDLFKALGGNPTSKDFSGCYFTPEINGLGDYTYYSPDSQTSGIYEPGGIVTVLQTPLLKLSLFLQGPYNYFTGWMNNNLYKAGALERISPYSDGLALPNNYSSFSKEIVDWVWIELRDSTNQDNIPFKSSALLKRNGDVVIVDAADGVEKPILLDNVPEGDYYVVVSHRNHLGVITANPIHVSCGTINVDLRFDSSLVQGGNNAMMDLGDGAFALYAGDYNGDGQVQNTDKSAVEQLRGISGYNNADIDMNGEVQNTDINTLLNPNLGKGVQYLAKKLNAKRKIIQQ